MSKGAICINGRCHSCGETFFTDVDTFDQLVGTIITLTCKNCGKKIEITIKMGL